jgi:hypothetical protein
MEPVAKHRFTWRRVSPQQRYFRKHAAQFIETYLVAVRQDRMTCRPISEQRSYMREFRIHVVTVVRHQCSIHIPQHGTNLVPLEERRIDFSDSFELIRRLELGQKMPDAGDRLEEGGEVVGCHEEKVTGWGKGKRERGKGMVGDFAGGVG